MTRNAMPKPDSIRDIAKIKIAVKQLGIPDDDGNSVTGELSTYRRMLKKVTGKTSVSMATMSDADRGKVLAHLRQLGFKAKGPRKRLTKAPGMASHAKVGLIYVLWDTLHENGAVYKHGPRALNTWVRHMTRKYNNGAGYSTPDFLPEQVADVLIEQLKQWCKRLDIQWRN